jgi:DNA-binding MarR family transcriptional regulator
VARDVRKLGEERPIRVAMDVHRCHRDLLAHAEAFGAKEGLEVIHLSIVHSLGLRGPVKMGELARATVIGAPDMTRRAKQLEERGLVARERSTSSQREVLIALTPTGQALFARSFTYLHGAHQAYFDGVLTATEQRELGRLLAKLTSGRP